jgi:hypothetical protein
MTGYHIYYQTSEDGEYEQINYLVQLASILNWKKNYGPIKLFCNQKYLESISKYGIDKEYDFIDTEYLESVPYKDSMSTFWSFCKIYVAKKIVEMESEFCILDTDLWIQVPDLLSQEHDLVFYHKEAYDMNYELNPYPEPSNWLTDSELEEYDWNVDPANCAIMYFRNRSKELVDVWYDTALKIVERHHDNDSEINTRCGTIFIEQRLLPTLAKKLDMSITVISPCTYLTWIPTTLADGREWRPLLTYSDYSLHIAANIKHVWGAKRYYNVEWIREMIIDVAMYAINLVHNQERKYFKLYNEVREAHPKKYI